MYCRFIFFVGCVAALFGAAPALAFSISPARVQMVVAPGNTQAANITVTNDTDENQTYTISVVGATANAEGRPVFGAGTSELEKWIVLSSPTLPVLARSSKTFGFVVAMPSSTSPGMANFAGVLISTVSGTSTALGIQQKLVSLVGVTAAGVVHESAAGYLWQREKFLVTGATWPIRFGLKNTGTALAPVVGLISIRDIDNRLVATSTAMLGSSLFPQTSRSISVPVRGVGDGWLPHYYRVELDVVYGYTKQKMHLVTGELYFPPAAVVIFLAIALVVFRVAFYRRSKRERC